MSVYVYVRVRAEEVEEEEEKVQPGFPVELIQRLSGATDAADHVSAQ